MHDTKSTHGWKCSCSEVQTEMKDYNVLEFELRASCLLSPESTIRLAKQAVFSWDTPSILFWIKLFFKLGSPELFAQAGFEPSFS
jgi:hypothetical protein